MVKQIIQYDASKTMSEFHNDTTSFVKGLMGPIGSGKSVGCVVELIKQAQDQQPGWDGIRRSRWAIIRNTYRELNDTTMRTFYDWMPKSAGTVRIADATFIWKDGDVEAEFLFRALDRPDDVSKLLSLELTGAWINEAREVPKQILSMLVGRVGRYPSKRLGGPTRYGVIMDTNPPDEDHWWYKAFEEQRPDNWTLYKQPGGLSKNAENIENLVPGYYKNLMGGQDTEWIKVYVHGKYGYVADGKPVHPLYNDDIHTAKAVLKHQGGPLTVGCDFGLTPAALVWEQTSFGQWRALSEVTTEDMGAETFGVLLKEHLKKNYPGQSFDMWGDPAGDQRSSINESETVFTILQGQGIPIYKCDTNDVVIRRAAIDTLLGKLTVTGDPALLVSPACKEFRKGMNGGFKYKRIKVSGEERFADTPDKHSRYSHIVEAGEYGLVGAGLGYQVLDGGSNFRFDLDETPVIHNVGSLW